MPNIDEQLIELKNSFENAIISGGKKGKTSAIRSSALINIIHDAVKDELIRQGVDCQQIRPLLGQSSPETKIVGFYKQKKQDICVGPKNIQAISSHVSWGPLASESITDNLGEAYARNTLVINVRSQLSSVAKNTDTLFERTIAESLNLHKKYPDMVLGEVYLIPTHEYDETTMDDRRIVFKEKQISIAKYISFFKALSERRDVQDELCKYERCALLVVDFNREQPHLFRTTAELVNEGLLPEGFPIELADLSFDSFAADILATYRERFDIQNLLADQEQL